MSRQFRIHGRIAAEAPHRLPASVQNARYALVRRDLADKAMVTVARLCIVAGVVVGAIAAIAF